VPEKSKNGRFLEPGQVSRKARAASGPQTQAQTPARSQTKEALEADMLDAELPPAPPPPLPPDQQDAVEASRDAYREQWRARKAGRPVQPTERPVQPVEPSGVLPTPPERLASLPETTALSGPCQEPVFLRLQGRRILLECTLQGPHPGQPHMHNLPPIEPGDVVFIGWWHQGE
jgi:hypothetical protein